MPTPVPKPVCLLRPSLDELEELWLLLRCIPVVPTGIPVVPTGIVVPYPDVCPGIIVDPVYVGPIFVVPNPVSKFLARFVSTFELMFVP